MLLETSGYVDAEFIAHAPDDVRALIAEVGRLREETGKLRALVGLAEEIIG
jgi:hypothetical protein